MGKPAPMKYVGLIRETHYLDDDRRWQEHDQAQIKLQVATPSGQIRSIPLDRSELIRLFSSAATHLTSEMKAMIEAAGGEMP